MIVEIEKARIPRKKDSGREIDIDHESLFPQKRMGDFGLGFIGGSQKRTGFKLSIWMWLAATIDALVVAASSCLLMLGLMLVVKFHLRNTLGFLTSQGNLQITFCVLFLFVGWMYFIASRTLTGSSIGEKTCSLRLGKPHERVQKFYMSRVIMRTTLTLLTGIVTLPLMALVIRKDIAGSLTGLRIYSLK